MNYVEKLFDEVHYVFNLNAATLSGAIDILVIPQPDGTLKCTPFHVRFGKMHLISSSEKVVQIYVNQQKTDLQMKLGHAGEAFFVEETEEPVPSILATSPITSPKPGRAVKSSTEELVSEFHNSRIISTKPTSTHISTSTTTTTLNNNSVTTSTTTTSAKLETSVKPLTDALEEIIISQQQYKQQQLQLLQQQQQQPNQKQTTTSTIQKSPTKKDIKRVPSPIYFEGSEDITLDSPINSYIINCESDPQTPIDESPFGSPPDSTSTTASSMLNATTTTTMTTTNSTTGKSDSSPRTGSVIEIPSDSESETSQKVGFWRWGGLPKFIRRNKQPPVQPTTITATTTPPNSQSSNLEQADNIIVHDNLLPPLPQQQQQHSPVTSGPTSLNNSSNSIREPSTILEINETQSQLTDISSLQDNSSINSGLSVPSTNSSSTTATGGDSSSWSRMGSFLKMFNKKEEPTFLVKPMNSPPPSVSNSELKQSMIIESNTSNQQNMNSSGDREIFLLEEEEEAEEEAENQKQQHLQSLQSNQTSFVSSPSSSLLHTPQSLTTPKITELNDFEEDYHLTTPIIASSNQSHQHIPVTNEHSYASIVKSNPLSLISENDESLNNVQNQNNNNNNIKTNSPNQNENVKILNDKEFPPLTPTKVNTPPPQSNQTSNPLKVNHHHHIEQLSKLNQTVQTYSPTIKLSLCGHLILDRNLQSDWPEEREKFFNEHIVTYEQLCQDPLLFKNPHLVAKIDQDYFPWSVAGHVIVSNLVFSKPITKDSMEFLIKKDKEEKQINPKSNTTGQKSRFSWLWKSSDDKSKNQPLSTSQQLAAPQSSQQNPTVTLNNQSPTIKSVNNDINNNNNNNTGTSYVKKSLRPTSEQLKSLGLKQGSNRITFVVSSTLQGTREVSASIYLWENTSKIVISDIDGTITKSDALGQVLPLIGKDWSHIGVAELYSNIKENGYQIIYLTSRAIGQAALTRTYISSVKQSSTSNLISQSTINPNLISLNSNIPINQNNITNATSNTLNGSTTTTTTTNLSSSTSSTTTSTTSPSGVIGISSSTSSNSSVLFTLPEGPVFMSPNRLLTSFNREVIKRNPEEFKIACLQDIQNIFPINSQPFYAGFGNRSTDATAYNAVGIPHGKTFTINANGVINTSNTTYNKTYTKLNDLVQDMFPSYQNVSGKHVVNEKWNEYHYWKKNQMIPASKLDPI